MNRSLSASTRGALWVSAAMFFFSIQPVIVRLLSDTISASEQMFFRGVVTVVVILPWCLRRGGAGIRTRRLKLIAVRSAFIALGAVSFFYAIARMPLAEAVSLHFTLPLFGMVAAAVYLGERMRLHRWVATLIGFAGALVILRPGFVPVDLVAMMVLFSALAYALGSVLTKELMRTEAADVVVFHMNVFSVLLFAIPAYVYWTTPTLEDWLLLIALGLFTLAAHLCYTRGMAVAEASFLFAFEFLRLPIAALAGLVLFAEVPGIWTWAGASIIFGATFYATARERKTR